MREEIFRAKSISTSNGMLNNLDVTLYRGEILGVLGMKNSGKGSLLDVVEGTTAISSGALFFMGDTSGTEIKRPNIYRVYAENGLVPNMTIWENILILHRNLKGIINPFSESRRISAVFHDFGIEIDPKTKAADITTYNRYQVELLIARLRRAEIVLIDTFSTELSTEECTNLLRLMERLKEEGMSFIITCFHDKPIKFFCDRIAFMINGRVINCIDNTADNLSCVDEMLSIIMTRPYSRLRSNANSEKEVMRVNGIFPDNDGMSMCDLCVRNGEIVALIDPKKRWLSHIERTIFRHFEAENTETFFNEQLVRRLPPFNITHGVAVLDTAYIDGVVEWMSPEENICVGIMDKISSFGILKKGMLSFVRSDFEAWYGEKFEKIRYGYQVNKYSRIALWLYKLHLAQPKLVVCKHFTTYLDKGMQWMLLEAFEKMTEQGTGILLMVDGYEVIENIADRYIVACDDAVSTANYSEVCQFLQML